MVAKGGTNHFHVFLSQEVVSDFDDRVYEEDAKDEQAKGDGPNRKIVAQLIQFPRKPAKIEKKAELQSKLGNLLLKWPNLTFYFSILFFELSVRT